MFLAGRGWPADRLHPPDPARVGSEFPSNGWKEAAHEGPGAHVSSVHPRLSDQRMTADIVGSVQAPDGTVVGYLGVSVLVERMGRRLSSIEFADQSICQVIDQTGAPLFTDKFEPNTTPVSHQARSLIAEIRDRKNGTPRAQRQSSIPLAWSKRPAGSPWSSSRRPPPIGR